MKYCNICKNNYTNCCCQSTVVSSTTINSDQAGRDGLDAKEIYIRLGVLPEGATDQQFKDSNKGDKGEPGQDGDTFVPSLTENFFEI